MLSKAEGLAKAGKLAEADALYQKLLHGKSSVALLQSYATFHNRYTSRFRRALPAVERLLTLRPKTADVQALAAETLANCNELTQARVHADYALALAPDNPDILFIAAFVQMRMSDYDAALQLIDRALSQDPNHRPALLQKARALLGQGDLDAALDVCRTALAQNADDLNFLSLYVTAAKLAPGDPIIAHMRDTLLPNLEVRGGPVLADVLKLLGKAENDVGHYNAAIGAFARAKAAMPMEYDAAGYADLVETMVAQTSKIDFPPRPGHSDPPILIVGMPRCGSTLIEQIMASHPQIGSAGESPALHAIVKATRANRHRGGDMLRLIRELPPDAAGRMAARYLTEIDQPDAKRVIDKSLHNFELLGVFAKLLPNARIIHVQRDPMDTCVSGYMARLSAWHRYTQSWDSLGNAYMAYRKLMRHWQKILPNPMLEVSYEDTVSDTEGVARRLIDFSGLDWDPACLAFQGSSNRVQTLSARQVREPLYTTSVQRWRRYEAHLDPLKAWLAPLYPDGFDAPAIWT